MTSPERSREQQIINRYLEGVTVGAVAREFELHKAQVSRLLNAAGIRALASPMRIDTERDAEITRLYTAGVPPKEIALKFNIKRCRISQIAKRNGVTIKPVGSPQRIFSTEDQALIRQLWKDGMSLQFIGRQLKSAPTVIKRILQEGGVVFAERVQTGEHHGMWRGGRIFMKGYWHVYVKLDHQFASMRTRRGYVAEHRLVMAGQLGRVLNQNETVHHIDGNKENNVPANLQLRLGPHGKNECYQCASCGSRNIVSVPID